MKRKTKPTPQQSELRELKRKFRDQVLGDKRLVKKYLARVVAYWMADYMTLSESEDHFRKTGEIVVWCSQEALAEYVGCRQPAVHDALKHLYARNHVVKVARGLSLGRSKYGPSNEYLMIVGSANERRIQCKRVVR